MRDILFFLGITPQLFYLSMFLVIIKYLLASSLFIIDKFIMWIIISINILVCLVLDGFHIRTFSEIVISIIIVIITSYIIKKIHQKIISFKAI